MADQSTPSATALVSRSAWPACWPLGLWRLRREIQLIRRVRNVRFEREVRKRSDEPQEIFGLASHPTEQFVLIQVA